MSTITFDTLKFAERLEKAGLTREQASAFAEAHRSPTFARGMVAHLDDSPGEMSRRRG